MRCIGQVRCTRHGQLQPTASVVPNILRVRFIPAVNQQSCWLQYCLHRHQSPVPASSGCLKFLVPSHDPGPSLDSRTLVSPCGCAGHPTPWQTPMSTQELYDHGLPSNAFFSTSLNATDKQGCRMLLSCLYRNRLVSNSPLFSASLNPIGLYLDKKRRSQLEHEMLTRVQVIGLDPCNVLVVWQGKVLLCAYRRDGIRTHT